MWNDIVNEFNGSTYSEVNQQLLIDGYIPRLAGINWIVDPSSVAYQANSLGGVIATAGANLASQYDAGNSDAHANNTTGAYFFVDRPDLYVMSPVQVKTHMELDSALFQGPSVSISIEGLCGLSRTDNKGTVALLYDA